MGVATGTGERSLNPWLLCALHTFQNSWMVTISRTQWLAVENDQNAGRVSLASVFLGHTLQPYSDGNRVPHESVITQFT